MPALVADHTPRAMPNLPVTELAIPALAIPALVIQEFDQWSEPPGLAYFSGSCTGPVEFELEAAA